MMVLGLTVTACGGSSAKKSASGVSFTETQPTTVQGKLLAQTNDEGHLPKEAALQLFALQYGPLPGVTVPKGNPGPSSDGTLAINNVFRIWSELTPEQQSKIREYLELAPDFAPAGPGRSRPHVRRHDPAASAPYQDSANALLPILERHFGPLGIPVRVTASTGTVLVNGAAAFADTIQVGGQCRIRAFTRYYPAPSGPSETMLHELFHCYQFVWSGGTLRQPNWVIEGSAEWVGSVLNAEAGGADDATAQGWLREWYATPRTPLFRRTYDAMGFFALAQQSGTDVMSRLRGFITAGSNVASYRAIAGSGDAWAASWATTQVDATAYGNQWFLRGTGIPSIPNPGLEGARFNPLGNGARDAVTTAPYTTARAAVGLRADLTRFNSASPTAGVIRLGTTQDKALSELRDGPYCTASDLSRCRCPEGTPQAGREFPAITAGNAVFAISGGDQGASLEIVGTSLEDECGQQRPCPVGRWKMNTVPTGLPFTVTSGGTGKVIVISADGRLVQSFAEYVPMSGTRSGATFTVTATGQIVARLAIPPGVTNPTGMRLSDVDASGLSGSERITFPDGGTTTISGPEFTSIASALADGRSTATVNCAAASTVTVTAGGITETYQRA